MKGRVDMVLAGTVLTLLVGGALVFSSAALGLLARGSTHISSVAFNHVVLGIGGGLILALVTYLIDMKVWRYLAPYAFGAALVATALVFIPGLGIRLGGGLSWLDLGFITVQPSEFLKLGTILFAAFYFSKMRDETGTWRGAAAFVSIMAVPIMILLLQPDLGTLGVITISVFAIYLAAGARLRDIGALMLAAVVIVGLLLLTPRYSYVVDRIETFINPAEQSALGDGFQIRQSLIAIGSGGIAGRGFGQGVQKFTYLPEPMGDSIYAVLAEEFGFIGAASLIGLFLLLAIKGYAAAARAPELFTGLFAVGISTYLVGEAFINIAAMLGMAPITGIPLTFISQGGSAMLVSLAAAGILLSISRQTAHKAS